MTEPTRARSGAIEIEREPLSLELGSNGSSREKSAPLCSKGSSTASMDCSACSTGQKSRCN